MQDRVDPPVASPVQPVTEGGSVALGGGSGKRGGAVEASEARRAGEAAGVADLDEQLGVAALRDPAQLREGRAGQGDETAELGGDLGLPPIQLDDVILQDTQACPVRPTGPGGDASVEIGERAETGTDLGGLR